MINNSVIHCFDLEEQTKYGLILISENNNINVKELQSFVGGYIQHHEDGNKLYEMASLNVNLIKNIIPILDSEEEKIYWRKYYSFYFALMQSAQCLINKECAYVIVTADGLKLQASMAGNDE